MTGLDPVIHAVRFPPHDSRDSTSEAHALRHTIKAVAAAPRGWPDQVRPRRGRREASRRMRQSETQPGLFRNTKLAKHAPRYIVRPWQCLNFLPEPQGQAALRELRFQVAGSLGSTASPRDSDVTRPISPPAIS